LVYSITGFRVSEVTKSVFTRKHDYFRQMLVQARKHSGLTQVQLAKRLSRPQSFVSKVERGERRLDVVEFLEVTKAIGADAFGLLKALDGGNRSQRGTARSENRTRSKADKLR
jgi:transcriptional regulator with XRE-family HTH domain